MVTAAVVAGNGKDYNVRIDSSKFPDKRADLLHQHHRVGDLCSINANHIRSRKKLSADRYVTLVKSNALIRCVYLLPENNTILFCHSVEDR